MNTDLEHAYYAHIKDNYSPFLFVFYYSKARRYPNSQFDLTNTFIPVVMGEQDRKRIKCLDRTLVRLITKPYRIKLIESTWDELFSYLAKECGYDSRKFNVNSYEVVDNYYSQSLRQKIKKALDGGVLSTTSLVDFFYTLI